jgi:hypothetical protein
MTDDEPAVSEADCEVCQDWPAADRETMRIMIDRIPLHDPVCAECQMAFWAKLLPRSTKPTRH